MMVRSYVLELALLVMLCVWTTLNIVGKMLRALRFGNFDFVAGLKCYSVADRVAISLHTGSFNLRFDSVIVFTKCHLEAFFGVCSVVSNLPVVSEHYSFGTSTLYRLRLGSHPKRHNLVRPRPLCGGNVGGCLWPPLDFSEKKKSWLLYQTDLIVSSVILPSLSVVTLFDLRVPYSF